MPKNIEKFFSTLTFFRVLRLINIFLEWKKIIHIHLKIFLNIENICSFFPRLKMVWRRRREKSLFFIVSAIED